MILDSRIHKHDNFREFTVIGAIAYAISQLKKGDAIIIEEILNYEGQPVKLEKVRMAISKVQKILNFKIVTRFKNDKLNITRV